MLEVMQSAPSLERVVLCDFWSINEKKRAEREQVEAVIRGAGFRGRVEFVDGSSLVRLPDVRGSFDLVGVDGSHRRQAARDDMRAAFRLLSDTGCMVVDDLVLHGDNLAVVFDDFCADHRETCRLLYRNAADWPGVGVVAKAEPSREVRTPEQEFLEALDATIDGRASTGEFVIRVRDQPGASALALRELERTYTVQDWDRVEVLLELVLRTPSPAYVPVLNELLDRQCLEIDNVLLVEAITACGDQRSLPALGRALHLNHPLICRRSAAC